MGFKRDNPGCNCCDVKCEDGSLAACLFGKCLAVTVQGYTNNFCGCCDSANRTWYIPLTESIFGGVSLCVWRGGASDTAGGDTCCPDAYAGLAGYPTLIRLNAAAEIGLPANAEPYIGVASAEGWIAQFANDQQVYTAVAWELSGAEALAAIKTLCTGGEVSLPWSRHSSGIAGAAGNGGTGIWPHDADDQTYHVCTHDGSSVTVQLVDCPPPPDPPPPCDNMDSQCISLPGFAYVTGLQDVHEGPGVESAVPYNDKVWTYANFNRPFNVTKTVAGQGIPSGSWCTGQGTASDYDFWAQLGTQSDYNNPGMLLRYIDFGTPTARDEVYVYGIGFGVTCTGSELRIEKVIMAIQRWLNYADADQNWPDTFLPLHQGCSIIGALVEASPAVIVGGNCATGTMGSKFSFDNWLAGTSPGAHSFTVNLTLGAQT